jgi:hypothetical protein
VTPFSSVDESFFDGLFELGALLVVEAVNRDQFELGTFGQIGRLIENNATLADPSSERLHGYHHSTPPHAEPSTIELKGSCRGFPRASRRAKVRRPKRAGLGGAGPVVFRVRAGAAVTRTPRVPQASRLSRGLPKKET